MPTARRSNFPGNLSRPGWLGELGFGLFAASWCLAWFTSLSLLRHAPPSEPAKPA